MVHESTRSTPLGVPTDVNQFVPELTLRDTRPSETTTLSSLRGQPVVLLFFQSSSSMTNRLIRYAREACEVYAGRVHIVLLAIDGEPIELQKLRSSYSLKLPIYEGRDLLPCFAGSSATRIVVLDSKGMVRMIAPDWREEYRESIFQVLKKIVLEK